MPDSDPAKMFSPQQLTRILILLGALAYTVTILWMGIASVRSAGQPDVPPLVDPLIIAVGTALAANFGAVLAISKYVSPAPVIRLSRWAGIELENVDAHRSRTTELMEPGGRLQRNVEPAQDQHYPTGGDVVLLCLPPAGSGILVG